MGNVDVFYSNMRKCEDWYFLLLNANRPFVPIWWEFSIHTSKSMEMDLFLKNVWSTEKKNVWLIRSFIHFYDKMILAHIYSVSTRNPLIDLTPFPSVANMANKTSFSWLYFSISFRLILCIHQQFVPFHSWAFFRFTNILMKLYFENTCLKCHVKFRFRFEFGMTFGPFKLQRNIAHQSH